MQRISAYECQKLPQRHECRGCIRRIPTNIGTSPRHTPSSTTTPRPSQLIPPSSAHLLTPSHRARRLEHLRQLAAGVRGQDRVAAAHVLAADEDVGHGALTGHLEERALHAGALGHLVEFDDVGVDFHVLELGLNLGAIRTKRLRKHHHPIRALLELHVPLRVLLRRRRAPRALLPHHHRPPGASRARDGGDGGREGEGGAVGLESGGGEGREEGGEGGRERGRHLGARGSEGGWGRG
mmetsp:Transcript_13454/g.34189  ORF Transcript_13454/g.34189 Transcript_13454/m.34189 type:complete len:238 (-) Transcript_13454:15-728(-)